jgi:hypothetical protein
LIVVEMGFMVDCRVADLGEFDASPKMGFMVCKFKERERQRNRTCNQLWVGCQGKEEKMGVKRNWTCNQSQPWWRLNSARVVRVELAAVVGVQIWLDDNGKRQKCPNLMMDWLLSSLFYLVCFADVLKFYWRL